MALVKRSLSLERNLGVNKIRELPPFPQKEAEKMEHGAYPRRVHCCPPEIFWRLPVFGDS